MSRLTGFQFDLRQLAVGVLYINLGSAAVSFPKTTRAHPSYQVFVDLTPPQGLLVDDHRQFFPFQVRWDIWQKVVVPLFDPNLGLVKSADRDTLRNELRREALLMGNFESLLLFIERLLLEGYEREGFVPEGITPEGFVRPPHGTGESSFPRFDTNEDTNEDC